MFNLGEIQFLIATTSFFKETESTLLNFSFVVFCRRRLESETRHGGKRELSKTRQYRLNLYT